MKSKFDYMNTLKNVLYVGSIMAAMMLSCADENSDPLKDAEDKKDQGEEKNTVELPEGYLLIAVDTFYITSNSTLSDQNYFRKQLNFSSKSQLTQSGNDGNTSTTFSITLTAKSVLTESGTLAFTDSRFPDTDNVANFYMSFFFNTGNERAGNNYLSPAAGNMTYTFSDGKFAALLSDILMTSESDTSDTFLISGKLIY